MISWIQHHLIRHGRWIFLTLLAVIIVAFVFTIGNTPGCTTDRSGYEEQLFYGIDLNSQLERDAVAQKVQLSAFLNGQQIRSEQQFQSALMSRIALLNLADEIGVPSPDQETLADYITTKSAFRGPDGEFSPDAYTSFVDNTESNPRTPQGLVIVVLEEDYRMNQISSVLSGPGYILPSEALAQAQRDRTSLSLFTADTSYTDFAPEIAEEEEALTEYYESNKLRYEIPERIKASYVFFDLANYEDKVPEATEAELREHFIENRARIVAEYEATKVTEPSEEADSEEIETDAPVTFENVRDLVESSFSVEQESRVANESAQAFAYTLYRDEIKRDSAAFNALLTEYDAAITEVEPYSLAGARQRALPAELLESAFTLGGNRYYSDAYEVDGGFAVLLYEGRIAPEIPAFDAVREEVIANYKSEEKRRLFNEKGEQLQSELETKLADGASFTEAAEVLELTVSSFETFTAQEAPSELNRSALQQAQSMDAGEISPMLTSGDSGIFVYVEAKEVPEIASDDEDLTQSKDYLARFAAYTSGATFANELVLKGLPEEAVDAE